MKKILASALLVAAVASIEQSVASYGNTNNPINLYNNVDVGHVSFTYDFDIGYKAEGALVHKKNAIVDTWIQAGLYSTGSLNFNVNLLDITEYQFQLSVNPFYIIPFWTSLYWTHPGALLSGEASELSLALESGYELHGGEVGLKYYINSKYPKVSFMDLITKTSSVIFPSLSIFTNKAFQNANLDGWAWNLDQHNPTVY
jgi:hypothetical protein